MFGAASAVDDGDTDPGAGAGSHKLERLQPAGARGGVERTQNVCNQVVGVLDTR